MILNKICLAKFEKDVARLNKKLVAKGMEPVSYSVEEVFLPYENDYFKGYTKAYDVTISKDFVIPNNDDWTVVAVVNHIDHIITKIDESVDVERYRHDSFCDHCHSKRFRKTTIIIKNKNGEIMSVGNTCINDFFGYDLSAWLSKLNFISTHNIDNAGYADNDGHKEIGRLPISEQNFKVADILAIASSLIRNHGFAPASADISTAREIGLVLNGQIMIEITSEDNTKVNDVLKWAMGIDDLSSNYLMNIKEIASNEYCSYRAISYIASMIPAYNREITKQNNSNKEKRDSKYVGTIGSKMSFVNMTLENTFAFESYYGLTYIHKFLDSENNVIIWKTKNTLPDNVSTFSGKIKDHTEYNGVKQTEISYVKF